MKTLALIIVGLLVIFSSRGVHAEEEVTDNRETIRELRQEVKTKREEVRTEIKELRQNTKQTIQNTRQELTAETAQRMAERQHLRFANFSERLSNLITRLENRIETFKAEGKDVTVAQGHLDGAKNMLRSAQATGQQAVDAYNAVSGAEDKQAQLILAKELAKQAKADFKSALQSLRQTIEALKALR